MPLTVYIIEPHPAVRESFLFLVGPMNNLSIMGSASSYEDATTDLVQDQPDIVLIGTASASDAPIRWLRAQCPDARILAATAFQTGLTPSLARQAGADVCVSRADGAPALLPSLRKMVAAMKAPTASQKTEAGGVSVKDLSGNDRKIFGALQAGKADKEVAESLGISVRDVQRRQGAIRKLLGADSVLQLRHVAPQAGWGDWALSDSSLSDSRPGSRARV